MGAGLAAGVLAACSDAGVSEFCICAGARNVSLVVGLERSTNCRRWHFYDERSAAFFALGRMMQTGRPVAVVTTSGTAVAELLPATVEAYYQSLPLVLVTADRPSSFRGSGAPQAIEQVGMMASYARCLDIGGSAAEVGAFLADGFRDEIPLHLNVCLDEPRADDLAKLDGIAFEQVAGSAGTVSDEATASLGEFLEGDRSGLCVLLGNLREDERRGLVDFLFALGAPVLAEAASGLREKLGGLAVREVPASTNKVLRIGGVPSARFWRDLEEQPEIEVLSVSRGSFSGLARESNVVSRVEWGELARGMDRPSGEAPLRASGDPEPELDEEMRWFRILSEIIPAGSSVLIGNSLPIREWNAAATFEDRGLRCFSCRGANGIDGALSTFFGLSEEQSESWVIVGDLTALYDLGAPWILGQLAAGKRRIVVINNGGGRIFSKLPSLVDLADSERRAIENDHHLELGHWAAMWGMGYQRVGRGDELVVDEQIGSLVVEIVVG